MQTLSQIRSYNPTPVKENLLLPKVYPKSNQNINQDQLLGPNGEILGILSARREKFHVSIRKKDRESIFSKKRLILKMQSTIVDEGLQSYMSASQFTTQDLIDNLMHFYESNCQSYYLLEDVYQHLDSYSEATEEKFYYELAESSLFSKHLDLVLQANFSDLYYHSYLRFLNNCLYLCPDTVVMATTFKDKSYDPTLLIHINKILRRGKGLYKMIPDALHTLELLLQNPDARSIQFNEGVNLFDPEYFQEVQFLKLDNRVSYLSNVSKIIPLFKDKQDQKQAVNFLTYLTDFIKNVEPEEDELLFKSYYLLQLGFLNLVENDEIIGKSSRFFNQYLPLQIKLCKIPKLTILMLEVYQIVIQQLLSQTQITQVFEFEQLFILLQELYDVYSEPKILQMIAETVDMILNQIYDETSQKINIQVMENIWHQFEMNIFDKSLSLAQVPFIEEQLKRKFIVSITSIILINNNTILNLKKAEILLKLVENNLSSSSDVQIINDNLQLVVVIAESLPKDKHNELNNLIESTKTKQQLDKLLDHENNHVTNQVELIGHLMKI